MADYQPLTGGYVDRLTEIQRVMTAAAEGVQRGSSYALLDAVGSLWARQQRARNE